MALLLTVFGVSATAQALSASTTTITANGVDTSTYGQSIDFTVVVASANSVGQPTGTVTLTSGATTLGTLTLVSDGPGAASARANYYTTGSDLNVGADTVTASYAGDGAFSPSSTSRTETVSKNSAYITSLVSTPNPSTPNIPVTFTASVSAGGNHTTGLGLMTGTVTFLEGATVVGTTTTFAADSVLAVYNASFTTSTLSIGDHPITASYSGDSNNTTSPAMTYTWTQTVNPIPQGDGGIECAMDGGADAGMVNCVDGGATTGGGQGGTTTGGTTGGGSSGGTRGGTGSSNKGGGGCASGGPAGDGFATILAAGVLLVLARRRPRA